jgi:potassium channel
MLLSIIWQKNGHQSFSAEATGKYLAKCNSCSASSFNQVGKENETEAKGRVTELCRNGNGTELDESGRHGIIHKTGIEGVSNIISDWPARGKGVEKHISIKSSATVFLG